MQLFEIKNLSFFQKKQTFRLRKTTIAYPVLDDLRTAVHKQDKGIGMWVDFISLTAQEMTQNINLF